MINNKDIMKDFWLFLKFIAFPSSIISFLLLIACSYKPATTYHVKFVNKTCISPYNRYIYELCSPLIVKIDNQTVHIPATFKTDLASIPRWYWAILAPQYSAFVEPGILHDYLYRSHEATRKEADDIFYSALLEKGVSHFTASKFYLALRLFGNYSYCKRGSCQN